jgi:hypothetical protein
MVAPLLKKNSPLLEDLNDFFTEFNDHLAKLTEFEQLQQSFVLYARDFVQLQFMLQIFVN